MLSNPMSLHGDVINQLNNFEVEIMMIKQELDEQKARGMFYNVFFQYMYFTLFLYRENFKNILVRNFKA